MEQVSYHPGISYKIYPVQIFDLYLKIFSVRIELKSGSSNYGGVIQTSNGKEIKFTSTSLADKKALQVGDNVCYQHGIHQTTGLVRAVNVQEWSEPK